jgi:uncharacterized membrane protein YphA (DoxX/SURF4 family)
MHGNRALRGVGCRPSTFRQGARFVQIPGDVFWPYFAGAVLSLAGAFTVKAQVSLSRGVDKIVSLGRVFFAMPMAIFGAEHFASANAISQLVPKWIPGAMFWTYFVGVALIAASLSIVVNIQSRLAATLLAVMMTIFSMTMSLPVVIAEPRNRIAWVLMLRELNFAAGALAFSGTQTEQWRAKGTSWLITLGRIVIGGTAVFYGVEQILHADCVPGVPLELQTPKWIPGHIVLTYIAGGVFIVAGARLLLNLRARMSATGLGLMVLVLILCVYVPLWGAQLSSIDNGLNYIADTLVYAGAVLLLAGALPKGSGTHA